MIEICEGNLIFTFPKSLSVCKYDNSQFHKKQFQKSFTGAKGVDFIVLDKETTWLIEVKDHQSYYHLDKNDVPDDICNTVAYKIRDTLAGLVVAKNNSTKAYERKFAAKALANNKIRLVFHLEKPLIHSKMDHRATSDQPNIQIQLRKQNFLGNIDSEVLVVDKEYLHLHDEIKWTVRTKNKIKDLSATTPK
ncbi:MAG TPA: hypothetical protein ENJ51_06585 [Leucothrix mucor]|uniref:Cysteinyl-tRNA synthetase n=1 Tax=Leucothrix mucor TaxID=45248 RepID=A0A7V2T0P7_LEUMU|nr:hypothetical protein [Leucothrix mucor]